MHCPGENTLVEFAEGNLLPGDKLPIYQHIDECSECDAVLATLFRFRSLGSETTASAELSESGGSIDRYRIVGALGAGAMGMVFRAHDPALDREVAVKVLLGASADAESTERALKEARALARLRHPAIVHAHDAGVSNGHAFIVMDFVDGVTLRDWMAESERTPAEVLALLLPIAEALAAAHRTGVIHGDVKPDNILVGSDGTAMLADFGLAVLRNEAEHKDQPVGGTPHYAAPELRENARLTDSADQFAFAATLHECLLGRDAKQRFSERALRWAKGESVDPDRNLPRYLREILSRALAPAPSSRFSSMDGLVAALRRRAWHRRRGVQVAAALAFAGVAAGLLAWGGADDEQSCKRSTIAASLQESWSPERVEQVSRSLRAGEHPLQGPLRDATIRALDEYAVSWIDASVGNCRATHVAGTQSAERLDQRSACLAQKRLAFEAMVSVLAEPIAEEELARAAAAARSLPSPGECEQKVGRFTPQDEAKARPVREKLARAAALSGLGRFEPALALAEEAKAEARELTLPAEEVAATRRIADIISETDDIERALSLYSEAATLAVAEGLDESTASYLATIAQLVAFRGQQPEKAEVWLRAAEISAADDPNARVLILSTRSMLSEITGDSASALRYAEEARNAHPASQRDLRLAGLYFNVGSLRSRVGQDDALDALQASLTIYEEQLGEMHPRISNALAGLGREKVRLGAVEEGLEYLLRAHAILVASLPAGNPAIGKLHIDLAETYWRLSRLEEAAEHAEKAIAIHEKIDPGHPSLAYALDMGGTVEYTLGNNARAADYHQRALQIATEAYGEDSVYRSSALLGLGRARVALGQLAAAEEPLRNMLALLADSDGAQEKHMRAAAHFILAESYESQGRVDQAVEHMQACEAEILAGGTSDTPDAIQLSDVRKWLAEHTAS